MAAIGTILKYEMLTPHVLELTLEMDQIISLVPGQRALFSCQDTQWVFKRAYSIVDDMIKDDKLYLTFCIKLMDNGRWANFLQQKKIGDTITIDGIFGHFTLQNTDAPKIFIGTGTGLAPLYNMAKASSTKEKLLLFAVPYKNELFYEDKIKSIPNLKSEIYITREDIQGYHSWRFDLEKEKFDPESEFYLCGNPQMVSSTIEKLKSLWYEKIYNEQF